MTSVIQPTGAVAAPSPIAFASCTISPLGQRKAHEVLRSGWLTTGPEVLEFEREFAAYVGAPHAVAVSSCTAAIELALRALGLPTGSPVLIPAITFCGAVQAVLHAGLRPVLMDVDPNTGMPTERTAAAAAKTYGAAAMVPVHWAGDPLDTDRLASAAGIPPSRVVVDAAHAVGTTTTAGPVGSAQLACFSFYANKNLPIGEGGMVTTTDPQLESRLRCARLHGMSKDAWRRYLPGGSWKYDVRNAGLKANMTDLQAAIGRGQLRSIDAWQAKRTEIARRYDHNLAHVPGIDLPHRPVNTRLHAWHLYGVRIDNRDSVMAALSAANIGSSVHFIPIHHLTYFRRLLGGSAGQLAGADRFGARELSLPMHPSLRMEDVDRVCDVLIDAVTHPSTAPTSIPTQISARSAGGTRR